jgi:hypothetical protein
LQTYREDKQNEPELFDELQRIMIHRFTKPSQADPGEEHAGSTQTYAMELQAAQRHSDYANDRKDSDGVCDRLRAMQFEEPAHVVTQR